jgi:hypothetical protein
MTNNLHLNISLKTGYPIFFISLYGLTTRLFIGFTTGKTLNTWHPKMVTDPCRSLATNPTNLRILLQSTPSRITSRLPVDLHSVFSRSPHVRLSTSCWLTSSTCCRCLYHVELPRPSTSTLPGRLTSTFDLLSIHLDFDLQSIHLD